jgi:CTP:molybdopterin cytidylyltransferase MocA
VIPAVILAAGASTRLGEPKQLAMLAGETLLERAVRVAREAGCEPVVVVLGAAYVEVLAGTFGTLGDAIPVTNDKWMEGMASSIRLGVRTLGFIAKDAEGVLLMTCDQPAVTVEHLNRIMRRQEVKASRYGERNGVPAYFPKKYFSDLMALTGDAGAKGLLSQARSEDLAHGDLDIDTPEDLARARELFG